MTTYLGATKSGNFLKISCAMMTTRWKLFSLVFFDNSCMQHERKTQCERARKNGSENFCFFYLCFLFEVTYILERMWLSKWRQENSTTDTQLRKPSMAEDLVAAQIQSYISNQSQYATKKRFSFDVACISHVCSLNDFC